MASLYRSKAVGEPPFMLGISVWSALRDALSSLTNYTVSPHLDTPATPERVMLAANAIREKALWVLLKPQKPGTRCCTACSAMGYLMY